MKINRGKFQWLAVVAVLLLTVGCATGVEGPEATAVSPSVIAPGATEENEAHEGATEHDQENEGELLALPELAAAELNGRSLQVIATTSVIGHVVSQVGGEAVQLTTLIPSGQDAHSYEPATRDLAAASEAEVIFINGWGLEERLVDNLGNVAEDVPLVPVSANIVPFAYGEQGQQEETEREDDHAHGRADPHVWFSIRNVEQWVANIERILSELDPANAELYSSNAAAYLDQLTDLDSYTREQLATIPAEKRVLVTNHNYFAYFARDYGFELLGSVIPGASTLAEPSANEMARLVQLMREHGVCTIFTETSVSASVAQTVAAELTHCEQLKVLPLYTEAIGPAGSGADSYIGMFRANVDTIVQGLK